MPRPYDITGRTISVMKAPTCVEVVKITYKSQESMTQVRKFGEIRQG